MGNSLGRSKVAYFMPTDKALLRISEIILPYDKEAALDYMDILEYNLKTFPMSYYSSDIFLDNKGIQIIFKLMKSAANDELCFEYCLKILEIQAPNPRAMMLLLRLGFLRFITQHEHGYSESPPIIESLKRLKMAIIESGSSLAMKEIKYQESLLRLCENCQVCVENHAKQEPVGGAHHVMLLATTMNERVDRILDFMEVYLSKYTLQCSALDTLILFVEKRNINAIFNSLSIVRIVGQTMHEYMATKASIIWRGCLILKTIASLHKDLARDVALLNLHDKLCEQFYLLSKRPRIQQMIIRLLGAMVQWHKDDTCRLILQQSQPCMTLFASIEHSFIDIRSNGRPHQVSMREEYVKNYEVILPVSIRTFIRESKGYVLPADVINDQKNQLTKQAIEKAKYVKPLFGTSTSKYFDEGVKGLVD